MLNGTNAGSASGLEFGPGNAGSEVQGLVIQDFSLNALLLNGTVNTLIVGNYLGTDAAGNATHPNIGSGVVIASGATANTIGGTSAGAGNLISGNIGDGVFITGAGTNDNVVLGNLIGTNAAGATGLGNLTGVQINDRATGNTVGGTVTGASNVISGNGRYGVQIADANANLVLGNFIGTNSADATGLGNSVSGIIIRDGASANTIGGTVSAAANVISGNNNGIKIYGSGTNANVVLGNLIGTNADGSATLPNTNVGVIISSGATANTIGGTTTAAANVISGNDGAGLTMDGAGTTDNVVLGNLIGTNAAGATGLGNLTGVQINDSATGNTVGGTVTGASNVISGNGRYGVQITGANGNLVLGNFIGTNSADATGLGNPASGIIINGGASAKTIGGTVSADTNVISGNGKGIYFYGSATSDNVVLGNLIGTNADGSAALPNTGSGVEFRSGPTANTIGGTSAGAGNLISGNTGDGVYIGYAGTTGNVVLGNLIGTNAAGATGLGNSRGVQIAGGATGNIVGGTVTGASNVISGNDGDGVQISGANSNLVLGNFIGTNSADATGLGNSSNGIFITNGASANTIGGAGSAATNVISGNSKNGIYLLGSGTTGNVVLGNLIGTNAAGTASIGNSDGVEIAFSASGNTVGGTVSGASNVISGNTGYGIEIGGANSNLVLGNFIGTNSADATGLGNSGSGIIIENGASANTIGGTASGAANVISGNVNDGISVYDTGTSNNVVLGNLIGANATGSAALPNTLSGIAIAAGATANTIGGTTAAAANVIFGNDGAGVSMGGAGTNDNVVWGNLIGTNATGAPGLGNFSGVEINFGASGNTVGGTVTGASNVISGNGYYGVDISNANGNLVLGNFIGTNSADATGLGNLGCGIRVEDGASANTIGGTVSAAANVVSGNGNGITIYGSGTNDNVVLGNLIGTNATGSAALPNIQGVVIEDNATANTIGGTVTGAANVISGNRYDGILISGYGSGTNDNVVLGNFIGTDKTATLELGNTAAGVLISGGPSSNTIGGTVAGAGNTIAFNPEGVVLTDVATVDNAIEENSIFGNTGLGITLTDGLPNDGQPAPHLTSAVSTSTTTVTGSLTAPTGAYRLEFFASPNSGPAAQGETFLGSSTVTVSGGATPFTATGLLAVPANSYVTATATSSSGDTSQFSPDFAAIVFGQGPSITSAANTTFTVGTNGSFTITTTGTPTPSISESGPLPNGVHFVDNGNGTATLNGTPAANAGGTYFFTITAANGISPNATQAFTLTVVPAVPIGILVLNPTASGALMVSGNSVINETADVIVDSSSATAIQASSNASVTSAATEVVGGVQVTGNAKFHPAPVKGVAAIPDPFLNLAAPSGGTFQGAVNLTGNSALTINPGIFSSISVSGNAKLTLSPGIYAIAGGGFTVSINATVTGSGGVLIYNAGSNYPNPGGSFGSITISGNATVKLTPATTGNYAGIGIFQSRDNSKVFTLGNNSQLGLGSTGILYAPSALVQLSGNSNMAGALIVNELALSGNADPSPELPVRSAALSEAIAEDFAPLASSAAQEFRIDPTSSPSRVANSAALPQWTPAARQAIADAFASLAGGETSGGAEDWAALFNVDGDGSLAAWEAFDLA